MKTTARLMFVFILHLALAPLGYSQTTLTGNHLVTGNLEIGTYTTPKNLFVSGGLSMGGGIYISGIGSISSGSSEGDGDYSVGIGMTSVWADYALATGMSYVAGNFAVAFGNSYGGGEFSLAAGRSMAMSEFATAFGGSYAGGEYSTALGMTTANAYASVTMGGANISTGDPDEWNATDDLVVVGNGFPGTSENDWLDSVPSNALVVRKNANMRTAGKIESKDVVRAPAGGGLSMGSFTAGQNPATLNSALKYSGE
jgi:hypothetical protein